MHSRYPLSTPFPYTTLFRSRPRGGGQLLQALRGARNLHGVPRPRDYTSLLQGVLLLQEVPWHSEREDLSSPRRRKAERSEEHTSELQSLRHLVCRLLLEKKK